MNLTILKQRALMLMVGMMLTVVAFAQDITGVVKDAAGEAIIGASVQVKGTQLGSVTDLDGKFSIKGAKAGQVLVVSYVGYQTENVKVTSQKNYNVVLKEDNLALEELVVVGYGVQKKKDLTGSVASVKTEDITNVASADVLTAMQAKVPGVDLTSGDGQAGATAKITMRGNRSISASNSPLIIVDGVEYGSSIDIPSSDIESMDILKDAASTAIYGTKGANGVIIITTKRGKAGKTKVSFNAYMNVKTPTSTVKSMYGNKEVQRFIDRGNYQADLASGNWGESNVTAADVLTQSLNDGTTLADIANDGSFTDWYDMFMQNSIAQNYELSLSGGEKNTNFNASLAAMYDTGLFKRDKMSRYNGRLNLDHVINKTFKAGLSLAFTYRDQDMRNASMFTSARKMTSITHAYLNDGSINETPNPMYAAHVNPLMDEGDNYQRNMETTRFLGSAYLQANIIPGLIFKTQFSVDRFNRRDGQYNDWRSVNRYQSPSTTYISNSPNTNTNVDWQNTLNWIKDINKHNISLLAGHQMTQSVKESLSISGTAGQEHYYNNAFYDVTKIQNDLAYSSGYTKQAMLSFFGRINYSYDSKYLFQASVRADGASQLAEGHKWGYFPSVSAGWRIIDEDFMEGTKSWLSNLKLRASWGLSGNAAVNPYQTLATVSPTTPNSATNFIPMSASNPDLQWEKTSAFNVGLDIAILNGRVNATIDWYKTNTYDLLYYKSAPSSSVFTSIISNVGESKGSGIEIAVNALAVKKGDFQWDINANYTHSTDELVKLADGLDRNITGTTALIVGQPLSIFYDYETNGCWGVGEYEKYCADFKAATGNDFTAPIANYGTPGTLKIVDQDNNGKINEDDKRVYERSPKHIIGLTNTFTYQNWSLSVQCMARLGGYMQFDKNNAIGLNDGDANWAEVDYWTYQNQGAKFPSPGANSTALLPIYTTYMSSLLWEKADFFKIKDITLSYNLPKATLKSCHLEKVRVYASLKNYFTFSSVDNYDAERGGSINWPLAKQFIVGLNVSF